MSQSPPTAPIPGSTPRCSRFHGRFILCRHQVKRNFYIDRFGQIKKQFNRLYLRPQSAIRQPRMPACAGKPSRGALPSFMNPANITRSKAKKIREKKAIIEFEKKNLFADIVCDRHEDFMRGVHEQAASATTEEQRSHVAQVKAALPTKDWLHGLNARIAWRREKDGAAAYLDETQITNSQAVAVAAPPPVPVPVPAPLAPAGPPAPTAVIAQGLGLRTSSARSQAQTGFSIVTRSNGSPSRTGTRSFNNGCDCGRIHVGGCVWNQYKAYIVEDGEDV